ncbi:MAG: glycosyltransferase, partial [Bacteroides sp.]|nr:glycosyltransferase [Bacteroides sp.]
TWQDGSITKYYDKFIILTQEDKIYWPHQGNIEVIPNYVKLNKEEKLSDLNQKRVISVGRVSYEKGFDSLFSAWQQVNKYYPQWELDLIGGEVSRETRQELKDQITSLGLEKSVRLYPATNQIGDEYLKSSLYVLSSRCEGLPLVLIEAMSFGLPAVSFACKCSPKDIITDQWDGILVPDGHIDKLAEGIMQLLKDPDKLAVYGRNAFEKSKQFNEENIMKRWKHLFESLKAEKDQSHKSVR